MTMTSLCLLLGLLAAEPIRADIIIRGAIIHDGTGSEGRVGDIAILGERIVAVGQFTAKGKQQIIDASGYVVAPGFIDLHTHSDPEIAEDGLRYNRNYLAQGVTTIVTGNCGSGPVDVAEYLAAIDSHGAGTNVIHLLPQGSLRRDVVGGTDRPATAAELQKMKQLAHKAMQDGAWGMSSGLIYVPSMYANTEELVELAKVVAEYDGIYATHMRNESTKLLDAINEALEIGKRSGAPVHISHLKVSGEKAWGIAADAIETLRAARAAGQTVSADQYPYIASSTSLGAMTVPARFQSSKNLTSALADPEVGPELRRSIEQMLADRGDGARLFIASYQQNRAWQGRNLAELAAEQNRPVLELVAEIQDNGGASMINFSMSEEEVRLFMQEPYVATASDGSTQDPMSDSKPHPRSYGTFPRKIGRYAIEGRQISLPHAIRSASGLPADILGLKDRGYLREGAYADLVLFDPQTFRDTATFEDPHQLATGVQYLWVNGVAVIDDGKPTDALPGRALRHSIPTTKKTGTEVPE